MCQPYLEKTFLVIRCVPRWQAGSLLSRWISSPSDAADHFTSTTFPDREKVSEYDENIARIANAVQVTLLSLSLNILPRVSKKSLKSL